MANGTLVPSMGVWKGLIKFAGVLWQERLEVFPSGGAWTLHFGKPLKRSFGMKHDYENDEITLHNKKGDIVQVQSQRTWADELENIFALLEVPRATVEDADKEPTLFSNQSNECGEWDPAESEAPRAGLNQLSEHADTFFASDNLKDIASDNLGTEQPDIDLNDEALFTRKTEHFKSERVNRILELVEIGDNLAKEKARKVQNLIQEYADVFALSILEVTAASTALERPM